MHRAHALGVPGHTAGKLNANDARTSRRRADPPAAPSCCGSARSHHLVFVVREHVGSGCNFLLRGQSECSMDAMKLAGCVASARTGSVVARHHAGAMSTSIAARGASRREKEPAKGRASTRAAATGWGIWSFSERRGARACLILNRRAHSLAAGARGGSTIWQCTKASYRLYFLRCGYPSITRVVGRARAGALARGNAVSLSVSCSL